MPHSIRARLTIVFLGLATIPLLVVGFILISKFYYTQTENAIILQSEMAARLSSRVQSLIQNVENDLQMLIRIEDIEDLEPDRQELILSIFHSRESAIDNLLLLNSKGQTLSYHSRLQLSNDMPPQPSKAFESFTVPMTQKITYFGPVRFMSQSGEPVMIMAVPITDLHTGIPEGVLVADLRLKEIWDLVAQIRPGKNGASFIVDSQKRVVAHTNPSVVLRQTNFELPEANGIQTGLNGQDSVLVSQVINLGDQQFHIFVEGPVSEVLAPALHTLIIMLTILTAALLAATTLVFITVRRIVSPIEDIAKTARAINNGDLSSRVEVKSRDEIGDLATAFNTMTMQLQTFINELEDRVEKRTNELRASNKELEAFAYSVSHDLKAPLRHIDGFLELLQDHAKETLDDKSQHYMETISKAAKKMGRLIEDLLSFSRMGRQTMSFQQVKLNTLVQEIIRDLEPDTAGREIEWRVGDLPMLEGDSSMLRLVFTNLISNALKYTRLENLAKIEIAVLTDQADQVTMYIRDNGVGFDMTYVDKLFGVFQRLHRSETFEGTGIGLANVRRLIARHGGKSWAEGELNQGATFYIALPNKKIRGTNETFKTNLAGGR